MSHGSAESLASRLRGDATDTDPMPTLDEFDEEEEIPDEPILSTRTHAANTPAGLSGHAPASSAVASLEGDLSDTSVPPIVVVPLLVPVALPGEDIEADASIIDAIRDEEATHQHAYAYAPPHVMTEAERKIADSLKNPLEKIGESIEKGGTASTFEHIGDSISHGSIASRAAEFGRRLQHAGERMEERMENAAHKLKEKVVDPIAHPHSEKMDYAHPARFMSETGKTDIGHIGRAGYAGMGMTDVARHEEPQSIQVPAWVHEHHIPKIEREYPTTSELVQPPLAEVTLTTAADDTSQAKKIERDELVSHTHHHKGNGQLESIPGWPACI